MLGAIEARPDGKSMKLYQLLFVFTAAYIMLKEARCHDPSTGGFPLPPLPI